MLQQLKDCLYRTNIYRQIPAEDEFSRQQFILFRIFSFTGAIVCLGVFTKMLATIPKAGLTPWLILALGVIMFINFLGVRETAKLRRAYLIMMLSACALLHTVAYDCGGIMTGGSMYWAVIIIYAYLLLGKKSGRLFAIFIAFHMIYLYLIRDTGFTSFALFKNDKNLISEDFLVNALLVTYLVSSLCNYLQSGKNVVVQGLQQSKLALEEQNRMLADKNQLLKEYTAQLERSNRELEKFASVAAHDLKAPLRAIGNTVGMIEQDAAIALSNETRSGFDIIKGRVYRMEGLINGLMRYAKISRNEKVVLKIRTEELIQKIFRDLNADGRAELAIQTPFPDIHGCKEQWSTVFTELIRNSLSFNDKEIPCIRIRAHKENESLLCIMFNDNGPGIPLRYREKVFMIFQTLHARDEKESSGIGLALVKKILEEQGGSIELSDSEEGAHFRLYIPLKEEVPDDKINSHTIKTLV